MIVGKAVYQDFLEEGKNGCITTGFCLVVNFLCSSMQSLLMVQSVPSTKPIQPLNSGRALANYALLVASGH
jgi:hypothetical protein